MEEQARRQLADMVSFVVYGTIAVLAAVGGLALEARTLHAQQAAAVLLVVSFAAWLSHTMWRVVRARSRRDPEPERSHEVHELLPARARVFHISSKGFPETAFADDGEESRVCGRNFACQDECRFHLCASRCRKAKGLTA